MIQKTTKILRGFSHSLKSKVNNTRFVRCYLGLKSYFKPYLLKTIVAVTLCIPIGCLDSIIAMSLKPYTDLVMVEKSAQAAWYIPFLIVLFAVFQGILNYVATYLNSWVGENITKNLKLDLYKKLLSFEPDYFNTINSGEVVFLYNTQADTASAQLLNKIKLVVSRVFSSISLILVLIYNSPKLAIIAIFTLGCAFLPVARIRQKMQSAMAKVVKESSVLVTEYNQTFSGSKAIASYNLQGYQIQKFETILTQVKKLRIKLTQKTAWLSPIMHIIVSIGIALSITYGSFLIISGQITSGNFVSFLAALIMLYNPVKGLGNNVKEFQLSLFAIEQILSLLSTQSSLKNGSKEVKTFNSEISFLNVSFSYDNAPLVIDNVSFSIHKGESIALVGNSGGGKTTLVNLLPRFYDVSSGAIRIDGTDIREYKLSSLRNLISVVFQDNFLFRGSIRENIMVGNLNASEESLKKAIDLAYLSEFVSSLKDGLDSEIGERGVLLSGGQRQRIAIARAFIKNSPIIILDEATSSLDNHSESIVQKAIENLMHDKTVLVIAHRLSTIRNVSKVAVIDEGKLVEFGSHEELMKIPNGRYRLLYDMQFER